MAGIDYIALGLAYSILIALVLFALGLLAREVMYFKKIRWGSVACLVLGLGFAVALYFEAPKMRLVNSKERYEVIRLDIEHLSFWEYKSRATYFRCIDDQWRNYKGELAKISKWEAARLDQIEYQLRCQRVLKRSKMLGEIH